jgi:hypothetical protein
MEIFGALSHGIYSTGVCKGTLQGPLHPPKLFMTIQLKDISKTNCINEGLGDNKMVLIPDTVATGVVLGLKFYLYQNTGAPISILPCT